MSYRDVLLLIKSKWIKERINNLKKMENYFIVLLLIVILFIIFYLYLKFKFSYWDDKCIENATPSLLFGNLENVGRTKHFVHKVQEIYTKFNEKHNLQQYCGMYMLTKPYLLCLELDFVDEILNKNFQIFENRGLYTNEECDPLSSNLYHANAGKWFNLKMKLSPVFSRDKLEKMFESVLYIGDELNDCLRKIPQTESVDVRNIILRYTSDIIGAYALGIASNAVSRGDSNLLLISKKISNCNNRANLWKYFVKNSYPKLAKFLRLRNYDSDIYEFFRVTVEKTIKYRKINNNVSRCDFLTLLLQIKQNGMVTDDISAQDLGTFTEDELVTQVFMMFLDGMDTISSTLLYALYELAQNEKIQETVRNEIKQVIKVKGTITYDAINQMDYLKRVVHETIRKYSPVHTIYRKSNNRFQIPETEYTLNANTDFIIPVYAIHNDPAIYPNPEQFDPERFTLENIEKRHKLSFLGFGSGQRQCIGQDFGILNIKLGLCMLLREHRFRLSNKTTSKIEFNPQNLLLEPKDKIWLNIERI